MRDVPTLLREGEKALAEGRAEEWAVSLSDEEQALMARSFEAVANTMTQVAEVLQGRIVVALGVFQRWFDSVAPMLTELLEIAERAGMVVYYRQEPPE